MEVLEQIKQSFDKNYDPKFKDALTWGLRPIDNPLEIFDESHYKTRNLNEIFSKSLSMLNPNFLNPPNPSNVLVSRGPLDLNVKVDYKVRDNYLSETRNKFGRYAKDRASNEEEFYVRVIKPPLVIKHPDDFEESMNEYDEEIRKQFRKKSALQDFLYIPKALNLNTKPISLQKKILHNALDDLILFLYQKNLINKNNLVQLKFSLSKFNSLEDRKLIPVYLSVVKNILSVQRGLPARNLKEILEKFIILNLENKKISLKRNLNKRNLYEEAKLVRNLQTKFTEVYVGRLIKNYHKVTPKLLKNLLLKKNKVNVYKFLGKTEKEKDDFIVNLDLNKKKIDVFYTNQRPKTSEIIKLVRTLDLYPKNVNAMITFKKNTDELVVLPLKYNLFSVPLKVVKEKIGIPLEKKIIAIPLTVQRNNVRVFIKGVQTDEIPFVQSILTIKAPDKDIVKFKRLFRPLKESVKISKTLPISSSKVTVNKKLGKKLEFLQYPKEIQMKINRNSIKRKLKPLHKKKNENEILDNFFYDGSNIEEWM